ncbi:radical SAM protein [Candidatus Woesearchaeota archaeon]|nr:radical SAM protein [Candidatus Woesearchaeota archaeon]
MTLSENISVFIKTNACSRRGLDASRLHRFLELNNILINENPSEADYLFFFTCGFERQVINENILIINDLKKYKGDLIVSGCLPKIIPKKFKEEFKNLNLLPSNLKGLDKFFPDSKVKISEVSDSNFLINEKSSELNKAHIRIAHGCLGSCSFCSIKNATGKLRSKSLESCKQEFVDLLQKGQTDFIINAEDTGAYGLDINSSFADLMSALSSTDKNNKAKFFINDFHAKWALKYESTLTKLISEKRISGMLIPIQSGSDRIINLMKRNYTFDLKDIPKMILKWRELDPELKIYTHFIIGFPSESKKEFMQSIDLAKRLDFDNIGLFQYADIENTESFKMKEKIPQTEIKRRIFKAKEILESQNYYCYFDSTALRCIKKIVYNSENNYFAALK